MKPQELRDYVQVLKQYRLRYEPDWYKNFYAYENNTFIAFNRLTQTIMRLPYRKRFFTNLPETKKQADAFENLLLLFMPLFVVYPEDISDESKIREANGMSRLLKQLYIDWDANNITHEYVHNAIKYPISFWEVGLTNQYDPVTKTLKKALEPSIGDVWDWLFDPRVDFMDNQIIVKILRNTRKQIKEYKLYKQPADGSIVSASDFKEMINDDKYGIRREPYDLETTVAYQVFERMPDGIKVTIIDNESNVLKEDFYEGAPFFPVIPLQLCSGSAYQPSFVQNQIPINRSISLVANRIDDFITKFVKGSFLIRQGSEVTFSDENGSIVEYIGEQPTVMEMPQLPPSITQWLNQLFGLSARYGVNDIASGGTPRGSQMRAGKMMQQAVDNQRNQQKTPLDNLQQAFRRIAEVSIYYMSEFTDTPKSYTFQDDGGQFDSKQFIGKKYAPLYPNAIPIPPQLAGLQVEIEDVSGTTIAAKREAILELAKEFNTLNPTFQKVLIDLYSVGNTQDLMEDMQKNKTLLDNPEFQNLIAQARAKQLPPEEIQALSVLLKFLSKQAPTPNPDQMGVQSKPGSAPTPQGAPPAAPQDQGVPNAGQ